MRSQRLLVLIKIVVCASGFMGGAENDGHEIAGHENDGPNSRA